MSDATEKLWDAKKLEIVWNYFPRKEFAVLVDGREVYLDDVNTDFFHNYVVPIIDDRISEMFTEKTGLEIEDSLFDDDFEGMYIRASDGKDYYVKFGNYYKTRITGLQEDVLEIDFEEVEIRKISKDLSPF